MAAESHECCRLQPRGSGRLAEERARARSDLPKSPRPLCAAAAIAHAAGVGTASQGAREPAAAHTAAKYSSMGMLAAPSR